VTAAGKSSRQAQMCPPAWCVPLTSVRRSGSCVGSTANPRRSRGCARTRAAGCGSKGP